MPSVLAWPLEGRFRARTEILMKDLDSDLRVTTNATSTMMMMLRSITSIIVLTLVVITNAWTVPTKDALKKAAAAGVVSVALWGAPLVSHAAASQFDGSYSGAYVQDYCEYSHDVV